MDKKKINRLLTILFTLLTLGFILLMSVNKEFFEWAFLRHHNVLSWYIRPLILLPLCYFAYKRSALGISITAFLGLTSMFWFPEPAVYNDKVIDFLQMEKDYLTSAWTFERIMISSLVPLTLYFLCLAFWKRSIKMGIIMLILIAVLKTGWSVLEGGEAGTSVIIPAMVGLGICVGVVYIVMKKRKKI